MYNACELISPCKPNFFTFPHLNDVTKCRELIIFSGKVDLRPK